MTTPEALAAAATGAGGGPAVVFPSVNMTMTFALEEAGSKSWTASAKASAWLVEPPAVSPSTADFRSSTEVIICVSAAAVLAKLTMAIRLPEPIFPSWELSVASSIMSIKVFAPIFMFSRGTPAILPERSRTRAISVGLDAMSGAAARARVTVRVPSQLIWVWEICLLEFTIPIKLPPKSDIEKGLFPSLYHMRRREKLSREAAVRWASY